MADATAQGHIFPDESQARTGLRSAELEWRGSRVRALVPRARRTRAGRPTRRRVRAGIPAALDDARRRGACARGCQPNPAEQPRRVAGGAAFAAPRSVLPVVFTADEVVDAEPARSARAIAAFSGGLDSTCTAIRHTRGLAGWRTEALGALLLVHGFDIALDRAAEFDGARERARPGGGCARAGAAQRRDQRPRPRPGLGTGARPGARGHPAALLSRVRCRSHRQQRAVLPTSTCRGGPIPSRIP